jgi:hypothetical protein
MGNGLAIREAEAGRLRQVPFEAAHLEAFRRLGPINRIVTDPFVANPRNIPTVIEGGPCVSFIADDSAVLFCGGLTDMEGYVLAWGFLSQTDGDHMLTITRSLLRYLARARGCPIAIEFPDMSSLKPIHRFLNLLGFQRDSTRCLPGGQRLDLYLKTPTETSSWPTQ